MPLSEEEQALHTERMLQMQREYNEHQVRQNMLFTAIESRDMNTFVNTFRRLNHVQVHQLIFLFDKHGYTLIHSCAFFGQFEILKYLIESFKDSSDKILRY